MVRPGHLCRDRDYAAALREHKQASKRVWNRARADRTPPVPEPDTKPGRYQPRRAVNLPSRTAFFTGREKLLDQLGSLLCGGPVCVAALRGMGESAGPSLRWSTRIAIMRRAATTSSGGSAPGKAWPWRRTSSNSPLHLDCRTPASIGVLAELDAGRLAADLRQRHRCGVDRRADSSIRSRHLDESFSRLEPVCASAGRGCLHGGGVGVVPAGADRP